MKKIGIFLLKTVNVIFTIIALAFFVALFLQIFK